MTYRQLNANGEVETMHRDEDGRMKVTIGPRFDEARRERLEQALESNEFMDAYRIARDSFTQTWMPPIEVVQAQIGSHREDIHGIAQVPDFGAIEAGKDYIRDVFDTNQAREQRQIQQLQSDRVMSTREAREARDYEMGDRR